MHYYLPDVPAEKLRVETVAKRSKSWAEIGINVAEKVDEAESLDKRFALMLMMQVAFGLRRMEVLQLQPWKCDKVDKIAVYATKGGRPRDVPIDTPVQRAILDLVKQKLKKSEHLGWPQRIDGAASTFAYSTSRYNHLMERLGITKAISETTGHSLRAQFAENAALLRNLIPPTLGGTGGQMERDDLDLERVRVSKSLGHSRKSVTGAYYGSFGQPSKLDEPNRAAKRIIATFATIKLGNLTSIGPERWAHCAQLMDELARIDVYGDQRLVQYLWEHDSQRHAVAWLTPAAASNLAAIEVAALSLMPLTPPNLQANE